MSEIRWLSVAEAREIFPDAAPLPLRPIDRTPPQGFQVMSVDEASALPWHAQVMLWDGSDLWTAWVHSFTEDALNVQIVRSGARIALELWNPDMEDGPAYPPRDREGTVVAVRPTSAG